MSEHTVIELDRLPPIAPSYARALLARRARLGDGETIPRITARVAGVRVARDKLQGYCRVCGFASGADLPITYPHVLAFPVHMAVMTHDAFPLKLLGLVHVRNSITQHRAIATTESLDMHVHVGGHRDVDNGLEFDLVTQFQDASGTCVWESRSTMLARAGNKSGRSKKKKPVMPSYARQVPFDAPANIGRHYARHAGDTNPIHLSAPTAKLFGFPRAIAHGMWLKARSTAAFADAIDRPSVTLEVAFKRPVLLPGSVMLEYEPQDEGLEFALISSSGETLHMTGALRYNEPRT